jgi:hypothetical protein
MTFGKFNYFFKVFDSIFIKTTLMDRNLISFSSSMSSSNNYCQNSSMTFEKFIIYRSVLALKNVEFHLTFTLFSAVVLLVNNSTRHSLKYDSILISDELFLFDGV